MTQEIIKKLAQLKDYDEQRAGIFTNKQDAIEAAIPADVKAKLAQIENDYSPTLDNLDDTIGIIETDIKHLVLEREATVKGAYMAVWNKPRVSWDTKALGGYAAAHPEIEKFKKIGKPSVSIRRK